MQNPRILLPLLAGMLALSTQAQEFKFGLGYNGSNVAEAGEERWTGRAGYHAGIDLTLGNLWFLRPGLHFQVRNVNYSWAAVNNNGSPVAPPVEFRYTERSIRIPLYVGRRLFAPTDGGTFNGYLLFGPTALLGLSADLDNDQLNVDTTPAQWYIGGGAGLDISFLFVEATYNAAMSNVFEGNAFRTNPRVNQLNLTAGVRLLLAR